MPMAGLSVASRIIHGMQITSLATSHYFNWNGIRITRVNIDPDKRHSIYAMYGKGQVNPESLTT
jgi:hypothetical protein